jgi:gluconolactonase
MKKRRLFFLTAVAALLTLPVGLVSAGSLEDILAKRKPEALIDLGKRDGVELIKGEWRYSDTKIVEVDFVAAGPDGQPGSAPNKAYDFTPHAGRTDFDDSKWEVIDPTTLNKRRSTGRLAFNWYRIKITVPERIGNFNPAGSTLVFATSIDDYAEVWVDGELPRAAGQSGGSVIKGWNAENKLIIGRGVKPGQVIQLAIFGINGPLSNPPTNYIYMRYARLEFHKVARGPVALSPHEVNVEVVRLDPAMDAIVPSNPKIFKLAEGFHSIQGPVWVSANSGKGYLLFGNRNVTTIYKYSEGKLSVSNSRSGYLNRMNGISVDQMGNLYVPGPDGLRVLSPEGKHLGTILAPRHPQNVVWGDDDRKTLYMTTGNTLYRMRLNIPGLQP